MFLGSYSKNYDLIKTVHNHLWNNIFQCLDPFPFHPGQANEPIFIKVHMLKIHEWIDKRRRTFNQDIKGESIMMRKALCSYHVLNFRMLEGLRKLCSYKKKNVYIYSFTAYHLYNKSCPSHLVVNRVVDTTDGRCSKGRQFKIKID